VDVTKGEEKKSSKLVAGSFLETRPRGGNSVQGSFLTKSYNKKIKPAQHPTIKSGAKKDIKKKKKKRKTKKKKPKRRKILTGEKEIIPPGSCG